MKILVLSDSHGAIEPMVRAVERAGPDAIFHLGDHWRDGARLRRRFPQIPMEQVPGNCDYGSDGSPEVLTVLGGRRILLCHGHTYGVKFSLLRADCAAAEKELDLFAFGHTHVPLVEYRGRTLFLNPGSIGTPFRPTYGIVTIEGGVLNASTVLLDRG